MYFILFQLLYFVHFFGKSEAFQCYQCSYDKLSNTGKDWNNPKCMTQPGELDSRTTHYPCNDTGFCTFTETYSLESKEVTSYYRSCHRTSLGNQCMEEATRLMCFGSCKGDFCNANDTGLQHEKFFENTFQCYQCSYDKLSNTGKDLNNPKCMTQPGELDSRTTHYPCNDTGFCTFTEIYSLESKEVTSYYRSCSRTSLGNQCTEEATRLMCFGSCKGDFCNANDTGLQHVKFFRYTFLCYTCFYNKLSNTKTPWNNRKCINNPGEMDRTTHYMCDNTDFCIFQEVYSFVSKEVTSYLRSCSRTPLANTCTKDATRVMCTGSCKGDFCNANDTGLQHEKFFGSRSSTNCVLTCSVFIHMLICLFAFALNS